MTKKLPILTMLGILTLAACSQLPTPSPSSQTNATTLSLLDLAINAESAVGVRPAVALPDNAITVQTPGSYQNIVLTGSADKFILPLLVLQPIRILTT